MSYVLEQPLVAARATESARAGFIRRTYGHLAGAILAFVGLELLLFQVLLPTPVERIRVVQSMFGHPASMLLLLAAFIGFGWLAERWARSDTSRGLQYAGLALYVVIEAIIFLPILCIAVDFVRDPTILPTAAALTLAMFGGLTLTVFVTKKDFSFLMPVLCVGMLLAFGLVLAGLLFGFTLGLLFSFAMVALASGFILYDTSNVLHHYRTDQHVAAALQLFASVALLFFYILRILIAVSASRE
jgi:FtsH-binding integral membrane protein